MSEQSIAVANRLFEELLAVLDDAYWETATIQHKDLIYSTISLLNGEYLELSKLSIQDHGLPYEPISKEFMELRSRLDRIQKQLDEMVMRTTTATTLNQLIPQIATLIR
jgi:transcriptional regulator of aromatic amino acid metabolism